MLLIGQSPQRLRACMSAGIRLPSLRILLNLIFETLPMLGNVALLCLFLFVVSKSPSPAPRATAP